MSSKRISIDEYLGSRGYGGVERKHFARDNGVILKGSFDEAAKAARYEKGSGRRRFVMSAEIEDRDLDIVVQSGLKLDAFLKNPVAPWSHRSGEPPIGRWDDLQQTLTGRPKRTEGECILTMEDPMAQRVEAHWAAGSLVACSIGFMPLSIERREVPEDKKDGYFWPGYIIHEAELYECSPCTVPANPAALAKAAKAGDVMSRELIEQVLDCWDLKDGLVVPRKAYEEAHRQANGERSRIVVLAGKRFKASLDDQGKPTMSPVEPTPAEQLAEALESDTPESKGVLARLAKLFGIERAQEPEAEPQPVPAPELTPEQKAAALMAADPPDLVAKHELFEADAALAALDAEMGQHVPA